MLNLLTCEIRGRTTGPGGGRSCRYDCGQPTALTDLECQWMTRPHPPVTGSAP
jgi:hypothetical protein